MSYPNTNWEQLASKTKLSKREIVRVWNKNWILSYSGGADSTLTLHILLKIHSLHPLKNRKLLVYFLDHGDQPSAESIVRNTILRKAIENIRLNYPEIQTELVTMTRDMKAISVKLKKNFEQTSSRMRRRHLEILYSKYRNSVIITGHSMSDWLETLIMRMNRGGGIDSILPFSPCENIMGIRFFRPLALLTSEEIREDCRKYSLDYWNDPSNFQNQNKRSVLRSLNMNSLIYNPDGLRLTARNFILFKAKLMERENRVIKKLQPALIIVKPEREYRIKKQVYEDLAAEEKQILTNYIFKRLGLWPITSWMRTAINKLPFHYNRLTMETENWHGKTYLVFRKGQNNLRHSIDHLPQNNSLTALKGNSVTKNHYVQKSYGRKMIKKIFSEYKLSRRQKNNLTLFCNKNNPLEIMVIPLSVYGLKDEISRRYLVI